MTGRLALVVLLAWAAPALADSKSEAQAHLAKATEAHKQGQFAVALQELMTAYALDPQPELLYAIGQVHVKLGNCPEAITFYTRFLASKPDRDEAAVVRVAIETCKKAPPPVEHTQEPPPPPPPPPPVEHKEPPPPPPPVVSVHASARTPWFKDPLGDTLIASGVVAGVVSLVMYQSAVAHRSDADAAKTYPEYAKALDQASSARSIAVVFGLGGGALIAGGIIRYATRNPGGEPLVTPTPGGAVVGWAARF